MIKTRREILKLFSVFSAFCMLNHLSYGLKSQNDDPMPNIVIIYADDLGYGDLSCYGGDIPTPNIDSIAKSGIRFSDFYVSAPVCTPSRYSLLTGSYPQRSIHPLSEVIMPGGDHHLDPSEKTLAEYLNEIGYKTAVFGKWHLGSLREEYLPMSHGFDTFSGHIYGCIDYFQHSYGSYGDAWYIDGKPADEKGYSTDLITNHAIRFMEQRKEDKKPFFLYLPYNAPHYGKTNPTNAPENTINLKEPTKYKGIYDVSNTLQAPAEYLDKFSHVKDKYRRYYSAMVSCLDDNVGKILEKLKANGQYEDTMIWFISDNGGYSNKYHGHSSNGVLRGEKHTLREGGIRIPAMVSWKNRIQPGQVIDQTLCNIDIVPTLGTLAGYSENLKKQPIDGIDISGILLNNEQIDRDIFWKYKKEKAFRRGDWKLYGETELYNLKEDISEENNLADKYPEKISELQLAWQKYEKNMQN